MSRSSTSSSERSLALTRPGLARLGIVVALALGVVAAVELVVRLDDSPKGLPFESPRTGTHVDLLLSGPREPIDWFFMGSSQCETAVHVAAFLEEMASLRGRPGRAYNAGISGAGVRDVDALYESVFARLPIRTLVLLVAPVGASPEVQEQLVGSYGVDWLKGDLSWPHAALMDLHLYRYRRQYRDPRWQFWLLVDRSWEADLDRRIGTDRLGWVATQGRFLRAADREAPGIVRPRWDDWSASPVVFGDLQRTVLGAQRRGTRVVLVVPPQAPSMFPSEEVARRVWDAFLARLDAVGRRTGAPVLDFHDPPGFGDDAFHDVLHLRAEAAERFSRDLAAALASVEDGAPP